MADPTFFWHDYETFGADPRRDRPSQFAGIRTTMALEPLGEPVMFFGKPPRDCPPHPVACLITGIAPQDAERDGLIEAEFAAAVHEQLALPGTCGVGYNSLRFDDEFTRNLLYRNFFEPYGREWENGNSRWDLIDLVRMCHALRPEGILWPRRDDGSVSFRLEDLARVNALKQERAHDALSDVEALIGLARLIREKQPRLWDWYLGLRRKARVQDLLDVVRMTPVVHVSSRYPASRHCLAIVAPLAMHPTRNGETIVFDLNDDPTPLFELDEEAIADRMFTPRADLPEGIERVALRTVRANRSPALAPLSVLTGPDIERLGLQMDAAHANLERLRSHAGLAEKLRRIFASAANLPPATDPELALYDGFLPDADKRLLGQVRGTPPGMLGSAGFTFRDPRYAELLFRYRARNWPHTLDLAEHQRWEAFRQARLHNESELTTLTLAQYRAEIAVQRLRPDLSPNQQALLDRLEAWADELA
ncbi:exodeoxyribonuclease I [Pinirhizobacter soli]|uniref:exodeoxyribonuclease I n=1 Tax=Pinirhizobacter soli TaxID=2786953 RepID=UPI002029B8FB|nr:exodeoxyribonuclease I [Pinirhizobacter soli]